MSGDPILGVMPLGFPWETVDPFLFCAHHDDAYPPGNQQLGPAASLAGRHIGQDFAGLDGWRMYHGDVVPGFPQHPHRGFETVTVARRGFVDHADSLGACARFGRGDAQWMTAGRGIVHAEMFPLLDDSGPNPLELFQIWLNLPREDKLVEPHFAMLWQHDIRTHVARDAVGRRTEVTVIAGQISDAKAPAPAPRSWAARPNTNVAIWTIAMAPHAEWRIPAAAASSNRTLYFYRGSSLRCAGREVPAHSGIRLRADGDAELKGGAQPSELLLLQGRPIGEPVAHHGPFVMNTPDDLRQAFADYQRTQFGGWPWPTPGPVHDRDAGRFAKHGDEKVERPGD